MPDLLQFRGETPPSVDLEVDETTPRSPVVFKLTFLNESPAWINRVLIGVLTSSKQQSTLPDTLQSRTPDGVNVARHILLDEPMVIEPFGGFKLSAGVNVLRNAASSNQAAVLYVVAELNGVSRLEFYSLKFRMENRKVMTTRYPYRYTGGLVADISEVGFARLVDGAKFELA